MAGFLNLRWQVVRQNCCAIHVHHCIFQCIYQLPDIARPVICAKRTKRLVSELDVTPLRRASILANMVPTM